MLQHNIYLWPPRSFRHTPQMLVPTIYPLLIVQCQGLSLIVHQNHRPSDIIKIETMNRQELWQQQDLFHKPLVITETVSALPRRN